MIILCFLVFLSNFKSVNLIIRVLSDEHILRFFDKPRESDILDRKKDNCWCHANVYPIIWSELPNIASNLYQIHSRNKNFRNVIPVFIQ